jgi:hypothetical protein
MNDDRRAAKVTRDSAHFLPRHHDRQTARLARADHVLEPRKRVVEHVSVQEEESVPCLSLP